MKCLTWRVSAQGCKIINPGVTKSKCAGVQLQGDQESAGSHSGYLAEQENTPKLLLGLGSHSW